jgi:hypothetical protein
MIDRVCLEQTTLVTVEAVAVVTMTGTGTTEEVLDVSTGVRRDGQ